MKSIKDDVLEETERLFEIFKNGEYSVRGLAKLHQIPFTTLRDRFRRIYGNDYTYNRGDEGTITAIIKEHINAASGAKRDALLRWWELHKKEIYKLAFEDKTNKKTKIYTSARIERDTQALYRSSCDVASSPYLADSRYAPEYDEISIDEWAKTLTYKIK